MPGAEFTLSVFMVLYHHYIGELTPREGEAPSFAQIYIHYGTTEGELENRQRHLGEA